MFYFCFGVKCSYALFTLTLMLSMLQTGDKSGEVTARMNLSDLRLVVGLKSNSNLHPNIFRNTNTNSSALPVSFKSYSNLPGKSALLRKGLLIFWTFWQIFFVVMHTHRCKILCCGKSLKKGCFSYINSPTNGVWLALAVMCQETEQCANKGREVEDCRLEIHECKPCRI